MFWTQGLEIKPLFEYVKVIMLLGCEQQNCWMLLKKCVFNGKETIKGLF